MDVRKTPPTLITADNWLMHSIPAVELVADLLKDACVCQVTDRYSNHPVIRIGYAPNFAVDQVRAVLVNSLDTIGWQLVTTGGKIEHRDHGTLPTFAVAPILRESATTLFHVTADETVSRILADGLLPANDERKLTGYPDTLGKIHGSRRLTSTPGEEDSAAFWVDHFAKKYSRKFVVLEVDLTGLPETVRVYRDTHSTWGLVVDRVDRLEPRRVSIIGP